MKYILMITLCAALLMTGTVLAGPPTTQPARQASLWLLAADDTGDETEAEAERREEERDLYEEATDALDDEDWEEASDLFDEVIQLEGRYVDAAMYWKAYALHREGRRSLALDVLDDLRSNYPKSRWLKEAEVLQMEIDREVGRERRGAERSERRAERDARRLEDAEDDELKLMIINSLLTSDPDRAIPLLEKILNGTSGPKVKEQALFVLAQSNMGGGRNNAAARDIIARYARDTSDPQLQRKAVEFLGIFGGSSNRELLREVYRSATDRTLKRQILESFMIAGDADQLLKAAKEEQDASLRRTAVEQLGVLGEGRQLSELYDVETDLEVRSQILEALMIAGESERLSQVAHGESSDRLREKAVEYLAVMGQGEALRELYRTETNVRIRKQILEGFMIAGDAQQLLDAARTEESSPLRESAVEYLGVLGHGGELWDLYQTESSVKVKAQILEAFMIAGESDYLLQVIENESSEELQCKAIEYVGVMGGSDAGKILVKLYTPETNRRMRHQILEALFIQSNVDALIDVARTEKDRDLRRQAVEYLSIMNSPKATDFLLELLDEE